MQGFSYHNKLVKMVTKTKSKAASMKEYETTLDYYILYFKMTRKMGIQPFFLDDAGQNVTSIRKGLTWFHFTHTVIRQSTYLILECLILFWNCWTHFKFDTLGGKGYLIQLAWASALTLGLTPILTAFRNSDNITTLFTDCIRFEKKLDGKVAIINFSSKPTLFLFLRAASRVTTVKVKTSLLSEAAVHLLHFQRFCWSLLHGSNGPHQ